MSWFRRGRRKDEDDPASWAGDLPEEEAAEGDGEGEERPAAGPEDGADAGAAAAEAAPAPAESDRSSGPWDVSEVDATEGYVDLGGIWIPGRDGMELRLEIEEATQRVTAATVQLGASAVQLQAFAAPRSSGIWTEIRAEIASGVTRQGGTADEVPGPFGQELLARIPVRTPDGRTGHQPARFVGIDGPRWFLRAVFHGAAAYEREEAEVLEGFVREVVVVRGADAMAPRELLSLRLPDTGAAEEEPAEPGRAPLEPFRRGPEITEVR